MKKLNKKKNKMVITDEKEVEAVSVHLEIPLTTPKTQGGVTDDSNYKWPKYRGER